MQNSIRPIAHYLVLSASLLVPLALLAADATANPTAETVAASAPANAAAATGPSAVAHVTLIDLLVKKGLLTASEADSLRNAPGPAGMDQLLLLLKAKGLLSDAELSGLQGAAAGESQHLLSDAVSPSVETAVLTTGQATQPAKAPEKPAAPKVIPAIAPLRLLPIDPPTKEGLLPGFKVGGVTLAPYGFIKATAVYDTSSPRGDDFPLPGFLNSDTGPNPNPEFHIKARAARYGTKFEWPDASKNVTITGTIEADYEGNYSRADNRNVSSIRSSAFSLRLAFGRIDWALSPQTDMFFEAGQDWSIFGSSAVSNILETTLFGGYWGDIWERSPQMRFGLIKKLGGSRNWKFSPEFALMMPSDGLLPADSVTCTITQFDQPTTCTVVNGLGNQLGYGERQGADSAKPEMESRAVLQFQLDKAPGVVPAQILWAGFYTQRQATVLASAVPTDYKADFPRGVDNSSNGYGNQIAISLPTRWLTVVASGYSGADLRFFFGDQFLSNYNYTGGLINLASAPSVDGSSTVFFGRNASGAAVLAPQLPVRGYGGFVQVGFPLSRLFNANPKGRNAGWAAYYNYGIDAVNAADFRKAKDIGVKGAGPYKSTQNVLTILYKMNPWVTFAFEETRYNSLALPNDTGVCTTKVAGLPSCRWTDWRTEAGPVFTF